MAAIRVTRRFGVRPRQRPMDRAISSSERRSRQRKHPKMQMKCGNIVLTLPFAPRTSVNGNQSQVWTQVVRPGRKPLLLRQHYPLRTQSYDLFFGHQDFDQDVGREVNALNAIAISNQPIQIINGPGASVRWRMTALSIEVTQRQAGTNLTTRATATVELTEVSDLAPAPGPIKGGVPAAKPVAPPSAPATIPAPAPAARVHTVVRGDTLGKISVRYYGTSARWKDIATANRLRNANLIYPGQRLSIPA